MKNEILAVIGLYPRSTNKIILSAQDISERNFGAVVGILSVLVFVLALVCFSVYRGKK